MAGSFLGVQVNSSEVPPASGVPTNTATGFFIGRGDTGPYSTYSYNRNIVDVTSNIGPRSSTNSTLFDAADAFFRIGGSELYIGRVVGTTPVNASLVLSDAGAHPTLNVTANSAGPNANNLYIVVGVSGSSYSITIQDALGNVIAQSPLLASQAAGIAWSATAPYVTLTASTASGATTNNPVALAATALSGGTDGYATVAEVDTINLGGATAGSVVASFVWQGATYTTAAIQFNATTTQVVAAFNAATPSGLGAALPATAFTGTGGPFPAAVVLTATPALVGGVTGQTVTGTGLTGGTATYVRTTPGTGVTLSQWQAAAALFPFTLGPGQIAAPGQTNTTVNGIWSTLLFHAYTNNRLALMDMDSTSPAALIAQIPSISSSYYASWGGFFTPSCNIPGVTAGTIRSVAASAVIAGLCALVDAGGNPNLAAAGRDFYLPYVTSFNWYGTPPVQPSDANILLMNSAGINSFENRYGILENFGFSSAVSITNDPIFWQLSASRMRMALTAQAYYIGEEYVFRQIDGKGILAAKFGGQIAGMLLGYYTAGALYGATAPDAFTVDVGPTVNTIASIATGKLRANVNVRISPFAQMIEIDLYSVPVTQLLPL